MDIKNKRIGMAITGSFCTLGKAITMLETLAKSGADIYPILSENVATYDTRFFRATDFYAKVKQICGKIPITNIVEAEPIGPRQMLDLLVIAPCTGNTLSKICYGITDTAVTMSAKAHLRNSKPLLIGISTNDGLSNNAKNIGLMLNRKNVFFIPFGQDDYAKKCNSLVSKFDLILESCQMALDGKQLQPVLA